MFVHFFTIVFNTFSDVCEFPRAWLLPVMKDNIQNSELKFFISHFLPIAANLRQKGKKIVDN